MNPLRKISALVVVLTAAALLALTGAPAATAETATGDHSTEDPTVSPTDRAYEEPDMTDVATPDPFVCPAGYVHVYFNDADACATASADGEPDPAGIVLDPSGGVLKPAGEVPAPTPVETPAPTVPAPTAPSTPAAAAVTPGPAEAAEAPSAPAQVPSASPSVDVPAVVAQASSDTGPAALVIAGATVALLLVAAGAFVWARRSERENP
ncbi:hypothetical protein [Arthrobacter sp. H-02-3]|uniref:hypothetical protein n=1 Tax=Arthrobacter sp. H-02-3 TaxID=2703675 RepID=UPI000DD1B0D2|nr:hypothetical protein [Arthrobacter sp. H-02-3]PVZ52602.1 hypothetical protein C9424_19870 [Arthrobacter sp. H-02-3]